MTDREVYKMWFMDESDDPTTECVTLRSFSLISVCLTGSFFRSL